MNDIIRFLFLCLKRIKSLKQVCILDTDRPVDKIHSKVKIDLLEVFKKRKSKVGEKDAASTGKYQSAVYRKMH